MVGPLYPAVGGNSNLGRLADYLMTTPALITPRSDASSAVCMNPDMPCGCCVFESGRLAKYCPSAEREAQNLSAVTGD